MHAHQQRVVVERDELQINFLALGKFLTSDRGAAMNAYLQLLELRIREF